MLHSRTRPAEIGKLRRPDVQMDTRPPVPLNLHASLTPAPDVLVQELEGESVLLNLDSERYFGLDEVGTRIWQLLGEHRSLERVCEEMLKEYDVDESELRRDLLKLARDLVEAGIVVAESNITRDTDDR